MIGLPRRLFWRVYFHGLLLLVLVTVALGITGFLLGRQAPRPGGTQRLAEALSARAGELVSNPEGIARDLQLLRELSAVEVTIYAIDGTRVATNVEPPLAPLSARERARLEDRVARGARLVHLQRRAMAAPIVSAGRPVAYAIVRQDFASPALTRAATSFAVVLLVLALVSFPLAKALTSPLERLAQTARNLGEGDLTARTGLRRGDEVGALAVSFDQMAERLERLVRHEKELLANVSHELRTPLARMRVALELAAEGDSARARQYLAELDQDLSELERLLEDVLTTARLDKASEPGGLPALRRQRLDPGELLEEIARRFRTAHPERALEVSVEGGPSSLEADPVLLRRALENLVDNARKYSDGTVRLSARRAANGLELEVRDQGIGIEESDLARLFTPFFRTDRSRARGTGGVGLGLALARRIVEAHGGRIHVESRPDAGTTVRVSLPTG